MSRPWAKGPTLAHRHRIVYRTGNSVRYVGLVLSGAAIDSEWAVRAWLSANGWRIASLDPEAGAAKVKGGRTGTFTARAAELDRSRPDGIMPATRTPVPVPVVELGGRFADAGVIA